MTAPKRDTTGEAMTSAERSEAMVDPEEPQNHGKPLWVVYGHNAHPQLLCVKLLAYGVAHELLPVGERGTSVCIWGYSVHKRKPGFRTLGQNVLTWSKNYDMVRFYDDQEAALAELRRLTTPAKGAT